MDFPISLSNSTKLGDLVEKASLNLIEIKSNWKDEVFSILENKLEKPSVLNSILEFAEKELKAKTVLVEPYISSDWADEYQAWYSRTFHDIPRMAKRLHFFSRVNDNKEYLNPEDLYNLPKEFTQKNPSPYLGYCVVRPLIPTTVAETVLVSPYKDNENGGYVHCLPRFVSHILGHEFKVYGMPFIEQDEVVSVCAEADLWMLARYLNARNFSRRYRPSEMAKKANLLFSVGAPRDGLVVYQMYNALKSMDFNAELTYPGGSDCSDHLRLLYACVKSEIPVIVAVPEHVLTVIGYKYGKAQNNLGINDSFCSYIDAFIVHDDTKGPYQTLKIDKEVKIDEKTKELYNFLTIGGMPVEQCLWVMPDRVFLRESDVRNLVSKYLDYIHHFDYWKKEEALELISCIYLRRGDQFKTDIFPGNSHTRQKKWRSMEIIAYYWQMQLPRYVWIVEFTKKDSIPENTPWERDIIGEMIIDSTAHPKDFINSILAFHLNGKLMAVDDVRLSTQESPYSPLQRTQNNYE
ncbi:hypothetical protein K1X84_15100 [bacterium]|nr:hypothetical protein [bacterium]